MFFKLSKRKDLSFPEHTEIGNRWWLSHDAGWSTDGNNIRKGYVWDNVSHGNHAWFAADEKTIRLNHDIDRSFPLFWNQHEAALTNMPQTDPLATVIWADERVTIDGLKCIVEKEKMQHSIERGTHTISSAAQRIKELTKQKVDHAVWHFTQPKKLFLTGGMDTATLHAVTNAGTPGVENIDYEHFEYDSFVNKHLDSMTPIPYWGYNQIHHWREPTVLYTGGCGDEFFLRGPDAVGKYFAWHDIDFAGELESAAGYHVQYYRKPKNIKIFKQYYAQREELKRKWPTYQHLADEIVNNNLNDHQHWHLGNTTTFTPFKDIRITHTMLGLSVDDMFKHAIDATVNKEIISSIDSRILEHVSTSKNINTRSKLL